MAATGRSDHRLTARPLGLHSTPLGTTERRGKVTDPVVDLVEAGAGDARRRVERWPLPERFSPNVPPGGALPAPG
jgi:hypothetical protein